MKLFFRYFFRIIRIIAGPIMLLWEVISSPKGIERSQDEQKLVNDKTNYLALYQYPTCPFCIKVRREIKRLSLNIELRDAKNDDEFQLELLAQGGKAQVPCLKISNSQNDEVEWMYESDAINSYLQSNFA